MLYVLAAWLVAADVVLQLYFGGYGFFSEGNFGYHVQNANVVLGLMLAALLLALVAWVGVGRVLLHVLLPVLWFGQIGIFIVAGALGASPPPHKAPEPPISIWVVSLHVVNGLAMILVAFGLAVRAHRVLRPASQSRSLEDSHAEPAPRPSAS